MISFSDFPYGFSFKMGNISTLLTVVVLAALYYLIKPEHGYKLNKWQALKYSVLTFLFPALILLAFFMLLIPLNNVMQALPSVVAASIMMIIMFLCLLSPVILMVFKMRYNISSALMILLLTALSAGVTEYITQLF